MKCVVLAFDYFFKALRHCKARRTAGRKDTHTKRFRTKTNTFFFRIYSGTLLSWDEKWTICFPVHDINVLKERVQSKIRSDWRFLHHKVHQKYFPSVGLNWHFVIVLENLIYGRGKRGIFAVILVIIWLHWEQMPHLSQLDDPSGECKIVYYSVLQQPPISFN